MKTFQNKIQIERVYTAYLIIRALSANECIIRTDLIFGRITKYVMTSKQPRLTQEHEIRIHHQHRKNVRLQLSQK